MTLARRTATVQALAVAVPGAKVIGAADTAVTGIVYDSRLVEPGDLFAALRGADLDGHAFIADAERSGAAAVLLDRATNTTVPRIEVDDSRSALAALSAAFYGHPSREIGVVGITGTDGKTTTAYLVDHILRWSGARTGMIGTVAVRIGDEVDHHSSRQTTPESNDIQRYLREMADGAVDWAVLEATSHGLAMHRLDHVRFRIGAVTNISHEHLDYHGTVEAYRRAKGILLERVAAEAGFAVVNVDDPGARSVLPLAAGATVLRCSTAGANADVQAVNIQTSATGSTFGLVTRLSGTAEVELPLIGDFNVANAVCAAAIGLAAGVDLGTIAEALSSAPAVPGRMERIDAGQPFSVVVDYAHTPDAMQKVLMLLRGLHAEGRLIAVFGSAGERDVAKRPMQGAVSARLADMTVITSEDPRFEDADVIIEQIAAGARQAGAVIGQSLFCATDRRDAIRLAFGMARPGDCVLLAGKGHEGSIIWGREKRAWDEAAVAREILVEEGHGSASD